MLEQLSLDPDVVSCCVAQLGKQNLESIFAHCVEKSQQNYLHGPSNRMELKWKRIGIHRQLGTVGVHEDICGRDGQR